jgi:hypothetical protein
MLGAERRTPPPDRTGPDRPATAAELFAVDAFSVSDVGAAPRTAFVRVFPACVPDRLTVALDSAAPDRRRSDRARAFDSVAVSGSVAVSAVEGSALGSVVLGAFLGFRVVGLCGADRTVRFRVVGSRDPRVVRCPSTTSTECASAGAVSPPWVASPGCSVLSRSFPLLAGAGAGAMLTLVLVAAWSSVRSTGAASGAVASGAVPSSATAAGWGLSVVLGVAIVCFSSE